MWRLIKLCCCCWWWWWWFIRVGNDLLLAGWFPVIADLCFRGSRKSDRRRRWDLEVSTLAHLSVVRPKQPSLELSTGPTHPSCSSCLRSGGRQPLATCTWKTQPSGLGSHFCLPEDLEQLLSEFWGVIIDFFSVSQPSFRYTWHNFSSLMYFWLERQFWFSHKIKLCW